MKKIDREAFKLAIEQLIRAEPDRTEQIDEKLKEGGLWEAGTFAAYCRQCDVLHLMPWQDPPCHIDLDEEHDEGDAARDQISGYEQAAKLLREMLALGVSRWHPDPLAAIEAAKKAAAR
jgi:hypothetical protein